MKTSLNNIVKFLGIVFAIFYPFVIYVALKRQAPLSLLSLILLIAVVLHLFRGGKLPEFVCGLGLVFALDYSKNPIFLKFYPVTMNCIIACFFTLSLMNGRVPVVERFARKMGHEIDGDAKKYTRKATIAWAVFMWVNTLISFLTVFMSYFVWSLYNGFISYILIGLMMGIEYCVRRKIKC